MRVLIAMVLVWLGAIPIFYASEKRIFNHGKCKCGGRWRLLFTDSQSNDAYKCDKCGRIVWLSWYIPTIDEEEVTDDN